MTEDDLSVVGLVTQLLLRKKNWPWERRHGRGGPEKAVYDGGEVQSLPLPEAVDIGRTLFV